MTNETLDGRLEIATTQVMEDDLVCIAREDAVECRRLLAEKSRYVASYEAQKKLADHCIAKLKEAEAEIERLKGEERGITRVHNYRVRKLEEAEAEIARLNERLRLALLYRGWWEELEREIAAVTGPTADTIRRVVGATMRDIEAGR